MTATQMLALNRRGANLKTIAILARCHTSNVHYHIGWRAGYKRWNKGRGNRTAPPSSADCKNSPRS